MSTELAAPDRRRSSLRRAFAVVDALVTPHGIDRYAELVAPTWQTSAVRGRVTGVRRQTPDTVTLTIAPNGNWTGFRAGQHVALTVEVDGVHQTRCYSMANSATDEQVIELTVKAHAGGTVSPHLAETAEPGLVVGLAPATGDFTLPAPRPERVLLISGGSGITPVLSMLRTLCAEGHDGPVTFLHYAPTPDAMTYRAELEQLAAEHPNVDLVTAFTDAPGAGDLDGRFSRGHLAAADPAFAEAETFLCGPAPLMDAVRDVYDAEGLDDRLHTEAFTLAALEVEAGVGGGGTLRFGASDRQIPSDGRTILEQAEGAGLSPASGCRMGICHTCTRTMTCGSVRNLVTGQTTTGAGVDVQLCVSVTTGDTEIDL